MAPVLVQIHFFTFLLEVETGFWVVALPVPSLPGTRIQEMPQPRPGQEVRLGTV